MLVNVKKNLKIFIVIAFLATALLSIYKNKAEAQSSDPNFFSAKDFVSDANSPAKAFWYDRTFTFSITNLNQVRRAAFQGYGIDYMCLIVNGVVLKGSPNCATAMSSTYRNDNTDKEAASNNINFLSNLVTGTNTIRVIVHTRGNGTGQFEALADYEIFVGTDPWISARGSTISTAGYGDLVIPGAIYSTPYENNITSFLGEQLVLSGDNNLQKGRASQNKKYAVNYDNLASKFVTGGDWYEYMLNKARDNDSVNITERGQLLTVSGTISGKMGVLPDSFNVWHIQSGDVAIADGTVCDVKGVFFIEGNLQFTGSFLNDSFNSGCVFITRGNINVVAGPKSTSQCNTNLDILVLTDGTSSLKENGDYSNNVKNTLKTFIDNIDLSRHRLAIIDQTGWYSNYANVEQFIFDNSQKAGLKVRLDEYAPTLQPPVTDCSPQETQTGSTKCINREITGEVNGIFNDNPREAKKIIVKIDNADAWQVARNSTGASAGTDNCSPSRVDTTPYANWQNLKNLYDIYYLQLYTTDSCGSGRCSALNSTTNDYVDSFASSASKHSLYCSPSEASQTNLLAKLNSIVESNCGLGYEKLEGFFITNGQFKSTGSNDKSMAIYGGVFSDNVRLNKDLKDQNAKAPAHSFTYDARYKVFFNDIFSSFEYSLREDTN